MVITIRTMASRIQDECLKVRKELFFDSQRGFDHNMGGLRTRASIINAEARVDNLTGGMIRFKFRSHRLLWFSIQGVEKRYIIDCTNKYDYSIRDNDDTNPYLTIEKVLLKTASELIKIEQTYNDLLKAA